MRVPKSFISEVLDCLRKELVAEGFEKHRVYTRRINQEVVGWLGLNRSIGDELWINPTVGVRNHGLEALVAKLAGHPYHPVIPPSIATNLGYLTPANSFASYVFATDGEILPVAQQLVKSVVEFGNPFTDHCASLENLYDALCNSGFGVPEQSNYRIPVVAAMLGRRSEAEEFLTRRLDAVRNRTDEAAENYRIFSSNLRDFLLRDDHSTRPS